MPSKLTEAQRRLLANLVAGRAVDYGFAAGRSTAGGLAGTFASLRRRGLISPGYPAEVTPAGIAALKALERKDGE